MAPIVSPFTKPDEIIHKVNSLSDASYDSDLGIENMTALIKRHMADVDVLKKLKPIIDDFEESFNPLLWATRDAASIVASHLSLYVGTMIGLVEIVETAEDRDGAVAELNNFATKKDPLTDKPLEGFPGVTKEFSYIWSISASDAVNIANVLQKAVDIKKTVKELTDALAPVKVGCGKVEEALKQYATRITSK